MWEDSEYGRLVGVRGLGRLVGVKNWVLSVCGRLVCLIRTAYTI